MKHWYRVTFVLVVIAALVLTACAPKPTPTPTPKPTATAKPAEPTKAPQPMKPPEGPVPAPEGDQTVDIYSVLGVGVYGQPWYGKITAEYEEMFPNVDVQWTWGGGEYLQKARARIAADDPPDAVWGNRALFLSMAREGVSQPVTEYFETLNFEGAETWKDTYLKDVLDLAWVEDGSEGAGIYGVPVEYHIMGMFYVDKVFEEQGIAVPEVWTWEEFLSICQQLKDAGIEPIAQDNIGWYTGWWFEFIAGQVAGQQVLLDTAMDKPGTSWVDNPDFLKAAKIEEEDVIKGGYLMEGYEGSQWPAGQMELTTGRCALILNGSWIGSELVDSFPEDWELIPTFFPIIQGKGTGPVIEAKFNGWFIPKGAKHKEAAIHFLKYMTSREIQEEKVTETASVGALKDLPLPKHSRTQNKLIDNAKVVVHMHHAINDEIPGWLTAVFHPVHDRFFLGEIDAEEFIEELQKSHDAYWAAEK